LFRSSGATECYNEMTREKPFDRVACVSRLTGNVWVRHPVWASRIGPFPALACRTHPYEATSGDNLPFLGPTCNPDIGIRTTFANWFRTQLLPPAVTAQRHLDATQQLTRGSSPRPFQLGF
jgi:hypothetical protein